MQKDPLIWCWAITVAFALLAGWNLNSPSKIYFDEVHYVPAARALLALKQANPEHPLLGKELIAGAIWLFGDRAWAWRLPALVLGTLGLFGFGRMLWWGTRRHFATLAGMVLLASDFAWLVQSRIATLDMAMAGFTMLALWQVAAAWGNYSRWRLALAGLCFGLAMAAKWSVLPVWAVAGMVLFIIGKRRRIEIALLLGVLPLAVYFFTFMPAFFYAEDPISPLGLIDWHRTMIALQNSVTKHHPYQSVWWQWVGNWRAIWYLYEVTDGAQRGILLVGNPLTMLAGLPALMWCLWRRLLAGQMLVLLYVASLGLWVVTAKPVLFYYHYLLSGTFLMALLALALDDLRRLQGGWRSLAMWMVMGSLALFVHFYPILAAMPLDHGRASFEQWMWLPSWR